MLINDKIDKSFQSETVKYVAQNIVFKKNHIQRLCLWKKTSLVEYSMKISSEKKSLLLQKTQTYLTHIGRNWEQISCYDYKRKILCIIESIRCKMFIDL